MKTLSALDHALAYAKHGFEVVPIFKDRKNPITPSGFMDASSIPEVIKDWWKDDPDMNVGIRIPKDMVVVDIDGAEGVASTKAFDLSLPTTLSARTGRGGFHFWYRLPNAVQAARKINVFPKIDLLTKGYVVAPPSTFGRLHYEWEEWDLKERPLITEAPSWTEAYMTEGDAKPGERSGSTRASVAFNGVSEGNRNVSLFRYACSLRGIPRFGLDEAKHLVYKAAMACTPPYEEWEYIVNKVWERYPPAEEENKEVKIWTLAELGRANLPTPKYYAWEDLHNGKKAGLLRAGVGILYSDPKIGKSALASYWARCVVEGEKIWGRFKTERTGVLYLDLEVEDAEAKERWENVLPGEKDSWPSAFRLAFEWPRSDAGGMDLLKKTLEEHPDIGLVVIDTLGDFWPKDESSHGTAYNRDQVFMGPLNKLASEMGVCLLCVHHTKKGSGTGKMIEAASGSMAITGKAKMVMSLTRNEGQKNGFLKITGKGIPERNLPLIYNGEKFEWTIGHE